MAKRIKLFKPGKHVAMNGETYEFSEADVRASVQAYNPELHAAPFVIGHPKHDAPAYGRLQAIDFADGFMMGEPSKVDPAFAEAVNGGKFDRVSVSFYSPTAPGNPVPGVYYPRHVGFLGALPPGVKGLGSVSFGESDEGVISFGDWNDRLIARMFRNVKNYLIETIGQEKADKVLDEWDLQSITEEAVRPEPPALIEEPSFSEPQGGTMLTKEQLEQQKKDLDAREKKLKDQELAGAHGAHVAFAEGLVKEGKLLPAQQGKLVTILDFAASLEGDNVISFGEGDGKVEKAAVEMIKDVFTAFPKIIEFGELGNVDDPGKQEKAIPANITQYV